jgi:pimeloyl-ACP methyl ester carboxylesterase
MTGHSERNIMAISFGRRARRITGALAAAALVATLAFVSVDSATANTPARAKPTIVLVHGAWADSSSWAPVTAILQHDGYTVLVAPNALRGLSTDAGYLTSFIAQQTTGPVVLVGHSYGGAVVTNSATSDPTVKALVYVDAFMPAQGESLESIIGGSTSALNVADPTTVFNINGYPKAPVGDADVYLKPSTFSADFAQDLPAAVRSVLAAGQLPITFGALSEPSGVPAWATIPSWDVVGTEDKVLPEATQLAMAKRAGSRVTKVNGSHVSMLSKPLQVAGVIEQAAQSVN